MCNLYSITTNQAAIIALFRVANRYVGNLAPMPGVFPDYQAPIVRNGAEGRELATARWGMPSSQFALMQATKKRAAKLEAKGKPVDFKALLRMEPDGGTTNIRNVDSKHWARWLAAQEVSQDASPRDPSPVLAAAPGPRPVSMGRSTPRRHRRRPEGGPSRPAQDADARLRVSGTGEPGA